MIVELYGCLSRVRSRIAQSANTVCAASLTSSSLDLHFCGARTWILRVVRIAQAADDRAEHSPGAQGPPLDPAQLHDRDLPGREGRHAGGWKPFATSRPG